MKSFKFAFKQTIPVLMGYLFLGAAFGLLLFEAGYGSLWAIFISLFVYSGSMQFVLLGFLGTGVSLISVILMTLSINSRHMFYGLSFLEKFKKMGKSYPYMIFSLTDETYSILCNLKIPEDLDEDKVMFYVSLLNQVYWVGGTILGSVLGQILPFDMTGIDFAMTALFVVIFVEQWLDSDSHVPAIVGLISAIICLLIFGPDRFILPALLIAVGILMVWKNMIDKSEVKENEL